MLPHPLTNFEIKKYENEPKFKGIYSIYKNMKMNLNLMVFIKDTKIWKWT